jgi:hypothetical protein
VGSGLNQISCPHAVESVSTQSSNPVSVQKITYSEGCNVTGDRNGTVRTCHEFNSEADIPSTSICNRVTQRTVWK